MENYCEKNKVKNDISRFTAKMRYLIVGCLLALCVAVLNPKPVSAADSSMTKLLGLKSVQLSSTSAKLKWKKKKNVKKYKLIYYYGDKKKKKTVKLKGSAHSYSVKKMKSGKQYRFILYGYNKKGKKIYADESYSYTGLIAPGFLCNKEEYGQECVGYPEYISLKYDDELSESYTNGISAKAVEIYRKESSGTYKKIKTLKKGVYSYIDRNVTFGKSYTYKLRSYYMKKVKKHYVKKYSKYSDPVTLNAVNEYGTFTLYTLTTLNQPTKELLLKLTADSKNRTYTWTNGMFYLYSAELHDEGDGIEKKVSQVSQDGTNWTSAPDKITLQAGKSIYLKYIFDKDVTIEEGAQYYYDDFTLIFKFTNAVNGYKAKETEYTY